MINRIREDVYNKLKYHPKRLLHVNNVMLIACNLAKVYAIDINDAKIAALAHDYSKYETKDFYEKYITKDIYNNFSDVEAVYHGMSSANYFKEEYDINNDVYNAIYYHTLGRPEMSMLEKIIYVSDSINLTGKYNNIKLYKTALINIDTAVYLASKETINRLEENNFKPHENQIKTYKFYKGGK